jgi:hypothetical protein
MLGHLVAKMALATPNCVSCVRLRAWPDGRRRPDLPMSEPWDLASPRPVPPRQREPRGLSLSRSDADAAGSPRRQLSSLEC